MPPGYFFFVAGFFVVAAFFVAGVAAAFSWWLIEVLRGSPAGRRVIQEIYADLRTSSGSQLILEIDGQRSNARRTN